MNILFDYEVMINQKMGGISKYFKEIISEMKIDLSNRIHMPVLFPRNVELCELFGYKHCYNYPDGAVKYLFIINQFFFGFFLKKKYDILHQTQYKLRIPPDCRMKVVVTVHDMIPELFPEFFLEEEWRSDKYQAMLRADQIIAISHTTKKDILRLYPEFNENKIKVIYHGTTDFQNISESKIDGAPEHFILFVGDRGRYKNFERFVRAMVPVLLSDCTINLVCTGSRKFTVTELDFLNENGIQEQVYQYSCSVNELSYLYKHAICFVFPSLYEGFGLPILEAFSAGCPVIVSDIEVFREVSGSAAAFFDPQDIESIRASISDVLADEVYRSELIRKGKERLDLFTWKESASKTLQLYQNLLD